MDAFFASIEAQRHPELAGKPIVIGGRGDPTERGVVSTASYEARKFRIHSGMPLRTARRLCPEAVFLAVDYREYEKVSERIKAVLREFSPVIEDAGIDEWFLDISHVDKPPEMFGREIKDRIRAQIGLTCSVGIAPNKLLAKIASDMNKPDGLVIIDESDIPARIWPLPAGRLPGVGPRTEQRLRQMGVETIGAIAALAPEEIIAEFGPAHGHYLHEAAYGIDESPLITHWEAKSCGRETTFQRDVTDRAILAGALVRLARRAAEDLRGEGCLAKKVTVKLRFSDFQTLTRDETLREPTKSLDLITRAAFDCLNRIELVKPVRLLGVRVGDLRRQKKMTAERKRGGLADFVRTTGGTFSRELGIDVASRDAQELFKWFLAAILFGARISEALAVRTYREFEKQRLTTAKRVVACGWDGLVAVLDEGGYVRYDFKTASKLGEVGKALLGQYRGDLNRLHETARDPRDLEAKLKALGKGIGDVTVEIFLREMRSTWEKADPPLSELAMLAAKERKLLPEQLVDRRRALALLKERWTREGNRGADFADFEAALVRHGLALRRRRGRRERHESPRARNTRPRARSA